MSLGTTAWRELAVTEKVACTLTYEYQIKFNVYCPEGKIVKGLKKISWKIGEKVGSDLYDLQKTVSFGFKIIKKEEVLYKPANEDANAPRQIELVIGDIQQILPSNQLATVAIRAPDSLCR